tara:strand:- start:36 stop:161 length:126 start_codon:yes stop_codon:yes gene_type:complete
MDAFVDLDQKIRSLSALGDYALLDLKYTCFKLDYSRLTLID